LASIGCCPVDNIPAIELDNPDGFKPEPLLTLPEVVSAELREEF